MAFKGEIAFGALNSKFNTGFSVGDVYRIQGSGNLVPNNYPAANGEFVKWTADGWAHSDVHYTTDDETVGIIGDNMAMIRDVVFDNGAPSSSTVLRVSEDTYDSYDVGNFWTRNGILYKITKKIHAADSEVWQFGVTSMSGVVPALNAITGMIDLGDMTEADLTDGVYTVTESNSHTSLALTTVATLTVKGNPGLGDFEILIDNSGNANDVTVTVKSNDGSVTYLHSSAGGTDVAAGKIAQLTCVGTCWTLAEFEAPTP